ncbi:MAG: hypothetical protein R3B09_04355 [Nannocystaceae bacterium]
MTKPRRSQATSATKRAEGTHPVVAPRRARARPPESPVLAPRIEAPAGSRRPEERPLFALNDPARVVDEALAAVDEEDDGDGFEPAIDAMIEAEGVAPAPGDEEDPAEVVDLSGFVEPEDRDDEPIELVEDEAIGE